jgi:hypothetical protein
MASILRLKVITFFATSFAGEVTPNVLAAYSIQMNMRGKCYKAKITQISHHGLMPMEATWTAGSWLERTGKS